MNKHAITHAIASFLSKHFKKSAKTNKTANNYWYDIEYRKADGSVNTCSEPTGGGIYAKDAYLVGKVKHSGAEDKDKRQEDAGNSKNSAPLTAPKLYKVDYGEELHPAKSVSSGISDTLRKDVNPPIFTQSLKMSDLNTPSKQSENEERQEKTGENIIDAFRDTIVLVKRLDQLEANQDDLRAHIADLSTGLAITETEVNRHNTVFSAINRAEKDLSKRISKLEHPKQTGKVKVYKSTQPYGILELAIKQPPKKKKAGK